MTAGARSLDSAMGFQLKLFPPTDSTELYLPQPMLQCQRRRVAPFCSFMLAIELGIDIFDQKNINLRPKPDPPPMRRPLQFQSINKRCR